jgi:hypothetical protein
MTQNDEFIGQLEDYLVEFEGETPLPSRVIDAIHTELPRTRQAKPGARDLRLPPRPKTASLRGPWGIVAAAVVVAILGTVFLFRGSDQAATVAGSPMPSTSAAPSAAATVAPTPSTPIGAEVSALLRGFLDARVAGAGAQKYLAVPEAEVPLLYATSSGSGYERGEFDQVQGIEWPQDLTAFEVRLFARDSVVEQLFFFSPDLQPLGLGYLPDSFGANIPATAEDGKPVARPFVTLDDSITLQVAHPWVAWRWEDDPYVETQGGIRLLPEGPVAPRVDQFRDDWPFITLKPDPVLGGADCQTDPGYGDAAELAFHLGHYTGVQANAPKAVSVGGVEGVVMDVEIAAGTPITVPVNPENGGICFPQVLGLLVDADAPAYQYDNILTAAASGQWMRLYLLDMPDGSPTHVLAIAIIASESDFDRAVKEAAPLMDSIEFRGPLSETP